MKALFVSLLLALTINVTNAQQVNSVDKITAAYIGVKNALVAGNAKLAQSKSADLLSLLLVPVKGLQPAQQKLYDSNVNKLLLDSRSISQTTAIDQQRERFSSLSKNLYTLLSGLKLNSKPVYQQYCPMKKAYWLSETEDIRNPYYGNEMLECGKVTATIKAK